jgi:hypothetical protein
LSREKPEPVEWPKIPVVLPNGGRIDPTDPELVPLGDGDLAPRQLTYSHPGDAKSPPCEIVFEVRGGAPVCTSLHLWSDDERQVRAKDLSAIKLDNLRDDVYAMRRYARGPDGAIEHLINWPGSPAYRRDRKRVEQAGSRRQVITAQLLSRVAQVHQGAPEGGRLAAVESAFNVQERQALRYIAAAKKAGLIDGND